MLRFNFISSGSFIIWLFLGYLLGFCAPLGTQVSEGGVLQLYKPYAERRSWCYNGTNRR